MGSNNLKQAPRCRHIKTNGARCGSPCVNNADHCYFHHRWISRHREAVCPARASEIMLPVLDKSGALVGMEPAPQQTIDLGLLEDRASVQLAVSTVLNALASGRLDQRRATALLYGLQLAASNCPAPPDSHSLVAFPVTEAVETLDGHSVAPA